MWINELVEAPDTLWGFREGSFLPTQRYHLGLRVNHPSHRRPPCPGPFLRTQGMPLSGPISSRVSEEPGQEVWSGGGMWVSLAMAYDEAWLLPGGHHSRPQRTRSPGHPDFQFPPGAQLPLCFSPRHVAGLDPCLFLEWTWRHAGQPH